MIIVSEIFIFCSMNSQLVAYHVVSVTIPPPLLQCLYSDTLCMFGITEVMSSGCSVVLGLIQTYNLTHNYDNIHSWQEILTSVTNIALKYWLSVSSFGVIAFPIMLIFFAVKILGNKFALSMVAIILSWPCYGTHLQNIGFHGNCWQITVRLNLFLRSM